MKKNLLIILDGYGEGEDFKYNAVTRSNTPFIDELRKNYPTTLLNCKGQDVGLPKGCMGGSEVGHFTIGAGRIVYQSLEEINQSIKKKEFFKLEELKKAAKHCRDNNTKFHILGMISDQGIHSHLNHLFALLKFAKAEKLENVYIHAITDGRDVPERSAKKFIKAINTEIKKLKIGKIATLIGRYYAMDRDSNFERTKKAYDLYTLNQGDKEKSALKGIENEYKKGTKTDYYINPLIIDEEGQITNKDSVVFFNYRSDRAQELTKAFTVKSYKNFKRTKVVLPKFVCFGPYSKIAPVLFAANEVKNNLGSTLSKSGKSQLRIAETEKYPHVTFFFNSQEKKPYKGQKSILIPSPKVPSYDQKPEMSCEGIKNSIIKELKKNNTPDSIVLNFANADLVGHSGNFEATVQAVETIDRCLNKIVPLALEKDYSIIITADHGNAEMMKYPNGESCPSHSFNPVIFMLVSKLGKKIKLRTGKKIGLKDIAPTILDLMKVKQPKDMTGKSLIK